MPSAQGHLLVRRRPKDGESGSDAVRYWVVPSTTQIKRAQDGTMYPSVVTCEKRKQTGNSEPIATNEGTLYYTIGYTDGSVTARTLYGSTGVKATSAMAWIKFMLEVSQVEVASETVSVVADGRSLTGVKEWYLRWPQSSGVTAATAGWSETVPQLTQTYKYLWNYEEIIFGDGTSTKTSPAIIGVYGRGIKSVTNYYLATSSSTGVTTKTTGWTTDVQAPTATKRYLWNYEVVTYDDDSTTTTDPHIICVYGEKGDPGEDAYVLDLDNEVQGIACNSSGNPTGTGTLASTNSTVYKGSKVDTGWTFSKTDTDCTSSIDANGTVSVTAISADKASVKVTATKGSTTLVATMSLYKVKPGANGTSPVVYSIETSVSAIGRNAAGVLNPTSFTAYKNKTVGATTSRTKEKILKYKRIGQDTNFATLANEGGTIEGMTAACTAIQIVLYDTNGTTELDVETIPIVKDGQKGNKGDDGVSYFVVLTPNSVTIKADGTVVCDGESVQAKAYKNVGGTISEATGGSMKLIVTKMDDGSSSEIASSGIMAEGIGIYATVSFEYRINDVAVASAALVINREGVQGMPGPTYKPLRVREWAKLAIGTELFNGLGDNDEWTDIVYKTGTNAESGISYWKVKKYFKKTRGQSLPDQADEYLVKTSNFGSLATDIFLANYALIRNLGVEVIDMRDSNGNQLLYAKDGEVKCYTGIFKNVNVSGALTAETLDLHVSTRDHNGNSSPVPNGSICLNADRICLPEHETGMVRTIKVLNPRETRATPNDLILNRGTESVKISPSLSWLDSVESQLTLKECGLNGGVYIELLGYKKSNDSYTYWLTNIIQEGI